MTLEAKEFRLKENNNQEVKQRRKRNRFGGASNSSVFKEVLKGLKNHRQPKRKFIHRFVIKGHCFHKMDPERGEVEPVPQNKVQSLRDQVDGVKDIMTQNVDRILARGERLDDLMGKSEDLQAGAQHFKQTSQKVARSYWWKNVKLVVVIVVIVLIIVLIIILLATGVIPVSAPVPSIVNPTPKP